MLLLNLSISTSTVLSPPLRLSQAHIKPLHTPPPDMDVTLQCKQQVSEQSLVHGRPFELWDAEHGGAWTGAELPSLLLRHGRPPEAQVHTDVPFQLSGEAAV